MVLLNNILPQRWLVNLKSFGELKEDFRLHAVSCIDCNQVEHIYCEEGKFLIDLVNRKRTFLVASLSYNSLING
jgi:hypothetical protein